MNRGTRIFLIVWLGQLLSLIGSGLTGFALGVWVYQSTGSVTQFALIVVCTVLPGVLISPVAGALVDRWNHRRTMILSDTGAGLSTLSIALLLVTGQLEIWHIYLATAISSTLSAFQWPAYIAATTLLIPKQHLGRASGLLQMGRGVAQLVAPVLSGSLLSVIQLKGIILVDFATFLFALATLMFVRFPRVVKHTAVDDKKSSLMQDILYGWNYLITRRGLFGLLIFFAASNFLMGFIEVLVTPLVLSYSSPAILGTIRSIGGVGIVAGSIYMGLSGGPRRRMNGVFAMMLLSGLWTTCVGLTGSIYVLSILAFLIFLGVPIISGCAQVIFQHKVEPHVQGRTFALTGAIAGISLPMAYLVAGPLADHVFEPLMMPEGLLAGSVGQLIGVGKGYGIRLMFIIAGVLTMLMVVVAYQYPRLRLLEQEIPDAISDRAADDPEIVTT